MKIKQYTGMLLALFALAGVILAPKVLRSHTPENLEQLNYHEHCKVSDGCRINFEKGSMSLQILPGNLPALESLDIEVGLEGVAAHQVTMEFIGRDMSMGLMPFPLYRQKPSMGVDVYTGTGSISFCTVDNNMVWLARLIISSESAVRTVVFELET